MASELPVNVSPSDPPVAFSIVPPEESVSVRPVFTTWAAAFDRSTVTTRPVVALKLSASVPPPDSTIVSLPSARSVLNTYVSLPAPPVSALFSELPVSVSWSAPPVMFSSVLPEESVSVRPAFTIWADAFDRSMATFRVVVPLKSSVSVPPPDSTSVSLPCVRSVSKTKLSLPAPPVSTLFSVLPVSESFSVPPITFSIVLPDERFSVSPTLTIWAAPFDRLTATFRVVVPLKSSVSAPPPDSTIVSLPSARSVSNT